MRGLLRIGVLAVLSVTPLYAAPADDCFRFCPGPTPYILRTLDAEPLPALADGRVAAVRGFIQLDMRPWFVAIEMTASRDGRGELTTRMFHSVGGAPVVTVRSRRVSAEIVMGYVARAADAARETVSGKAQRPRARNHSLLMNAQETENVTVVCFHEPQIHIEFIHGSLSGHTVQTQCGSKAAHDLIEAMTVTALEVMPECKDVRGGQRFNVYRLHVCMMLEGQRAKAAQVANIVMDDRFGGMEFDERFLRPLFAADARLAWFGDIHAEGGKEAASAYAKAVRSHGSGGVHVVFESFQSEANRVWVSGYLRDYTSDDQDRVAPMRMTWRWQSGTWKIQSWTAGPFEPERIELLDDAPE
jgi:hypothetical protein